MLRPSSKIITLNTDFCWRQIKTFILGYGFLFCVFFSWRKSGFKEFAQNFQLCPHSCSCSSPLNLKTPHWLPPLILFFLYNFDGVIPPGVTPHPFFGPSPLWYRFSFLKGPPGSQQSPHAQPPPHNPSNPMMGPHGQVRCKHFLSNTPMSFIPSKSQSPPTPLTHTQALFLSIHYLHTFCFFFFFPNPEALLTLVLFWLTPRWCQPLQFARSFMKGPAPLQGPALAVPVWDE